ncbi:hypothetical protein [Clostridium kluyveri]|uniref:DUF3953 domain-containing protein n=1 Tax=Clostridium kluyveri TaxID=1534 RepID=A0A1L5F9S2_CLOKL|nr:hypothetical protein [Clostridium kluyveri]APM39754.1 hypothetical protein BS101_13930 [Clostridium kluyveri]UZQ50085.1 hypothetical protein OP486_19400 [Clostridium kluyveri]
MKSKYTIIRFILAIVTIILTISILIGNVNSKVIMPYMLTCLGIFQVFNGLHFYKEGKKADGILLILLSIFIFGVVIKIMML